MRAHEQETLDALHAEQVKKHADNLSTYQSDKQKICGSIHSKMSRGLLTEMEWDDDSKLKKRADPVNNPRRILEGRSN